TTISRALRLNMFPDTLIIKGRVLDRLEGRDLVSIRMPVIGHAFVGLATAARFDPAAVSARRTISPLGAALWTPLVVVLAYLPDLFTQAGLALGWPYASLTGHSILVGALAGTVLGLLWVRLFGGERWAIVAIAVGSIIVHDLLDVLQATDRAPLW